MTVTPRPAHHRRRPRAIVAAVALIAAAIGLSAGEPGLAQQPAREDPASLALETLIARTTTAADSVAAVQARVTTLQQEEQAAASAANEKAVARTGFAIPDPPEAASPTGPTADAQVVVAAWQARQEALQALQNLIGQHRTVTQTHRECGLALLAEVRLLTQAVTALQPLVQELKRRHEADAPGADSIDATLLALDPTAELDKLAASEAAVKAALSRDDAIDKDALARGAEVADALTAAAGSLQIASAHLEEATRREGLRAEVSEQSTGELATLLATRLDAWNADNARQEEGATALDEARARVQVVDDELAALQPPAPSTTASGETEALRRARQALATAEQTVAYRRARLALLDRLAEAVAAIVGQLGDVAAATADAFEAIIEADVLVRLLRKRADEGEEAAVAAVDALPNDVRGDEWTTTLQRLRAQVREMRAATAAATARRDEVAGQREAVSAAIAEGAAVIEEQTQVVEREEQWAIFVRELEALDNAALLAGFDTAVRDLEAAGKASEEKRLAAERAQQAVAAATAAYDANVDPIVLAATQRRDEFVAWTVQRGLRDRLPTAPSTSAGAPASGVGAPATAGAAAPTQVPSSNFASGAQSTSGVAAGSADQRRGLTQELIDATRVLRDQTVARRLAHVREAKRLREQIEDSLSTRIAALRDWQATLNAQLQQARRAWAAARALQNRASAATLDAAQLPATVADYARRDRVTSLTAQVDGARDSIATVEARLAITKADAVTDGLIAPLEEWQANHAKQLELLLDLQALEETYVMADREMLSELESRKRSHAVRVRIEAETGPWESIVGVFASPETADFDELLREYYEQLLDLERQRDNLGDRTGLLQRLIDQHEKVKALFEALEESVAARVKAAERDLDVAATRVVAVLKPAEAATLLADLKTRTGVVLDSRTLPTLPAPPPANGGTSGASDPNADAEAHQRATAKLIDSALDEWARVVGYREWRTQIADSRADLGSIDAEIGRLRDVTAALASAQEDLTRQIARLTGHGKSTHDALPADERPTDANRNRYILGEIGVLRRERLEKLNWAAASTLIWLFVIPFVAFLAIRAAGLVGARVISRFSAKDDEEERGRKSREREERARTLFLVFRAAWTIIVVVLALIYMLKAINVDVTPMIASAGILGLAIAFGAQPLVRDFFAGFFILLENQYNLGDVVTINGIEGTIDKITLRLTIMRDLEGIVHYIPNGHIEIVSNQTKAWARCTLDVGVKREVDADEAAETINRIGRELKGDDAVGKHVLEFEIPGVERFDDEAAVFRVHIKVVAGQQWRVAREFRKRVKSAIDVRFIADTPRQHPINTRREGEED